MDTAALVTHIIVQFPLGAGKRFLEILEKEDFPFEAAFWVLDLFDERWRLYIVTPKVETQGKTKTYLKLYETIDNYPEINQESKRNEYTLEKRDIGLMIPSDPTYQSLKNTHHPVTDGKYIRRLSTEENHFTEAYLYCI